MAKAWGSNQQVSPIPTVGKYSGDGSEQKSGDLTGEADNSEQEAEPVKRYTNQLMATCCIHVPTRDTL